MERQLAVQAPVYLSILFGNVLRVGKCLFQFRRLLDAPPMYSTQIMIAFSPSSAWLASSFAQPFIRVQILIAALAQAG